MAVPDPAPINIGGQPDLDHIVGRRAELALIWQTFIDGASVILTGERRIGKSWVAKALLLEPAPGNLVIYLDVENQSSVESFLEALRTELIAKLPLGKRAREHLRKTGLKEVKGVPVPLVHDEALAALPRLIRDVTDAIDGTLVVVLDELPTFVQALATSDIDAAVNFLRTLRSLRHSEPRLRFVFAGSIGFHHILARHGDINDAVNEMQPAPVGPLSDTEAQLLAARLLVGIGIDVTPGHELAHAVASAAEGIAYYVQLTVKTIRDGWSDGTSGGPALSPEDVIRIRDEALCAGDDPWRMEHYITRIQEYFGPEAPLARATLDRLSVEDEGLTLSDLANTVAAHPETAPFDPARDRDRLLHVVRRLGLDHYVVHDATSGVIRFQYELVRRGWRARRYLG